MEGSSGRSGALRAIRLAVGSSVLVAFDRVLTTGALLLLLMGTAAMAWEAGQVPAEVVPVAHVGQGPPAPEDPRPFLMWQAILAAGSLAVTLCYLWSFFGLSKRVSWHFVVGIQWVVLLVTTVRLLITVFGALQLFGLVGSVSWAILPIASVWLMVAWQTVVVSAAVLAIGALTRAPVMRLFGVEADRYRRARGRRRPPRDR